ncbi:hypothetical protein CesoFtcFv8_002960 [Champsocephalus esox]|uniref:Uncharacterized protein n=1 Tax=Champsocephalus esox TaxID=159716 RepID=A0AAN8HI41_9TELE|nr:hypothetical protein CesoFtcFv8_002960 [Champsocephalus esox]
MGTILQERAPQQHAERVSIIRDRKNNNTPNVASSRMGRRQTQRKPVQPQYMLPSQENMNEKRLQPRRKQKPNPPSTKRATSHHRTQGSSEAKSNRPSPAEDRSSQHKEHSGVRTSRRSAAFPCHNLSKTSPDLEPPSEVGVLSVDGDSDSDLSESERLPVGSFSRVPPELHLRPEVIEAEDLSSRCQRPRGHGLGAFDFPDFLPPPFNSWSLSHLAVFYNTEGRGAPRPRAVGPLERYLERLLQLEWRQIQSVEEDGGNPGDFSSSCHKSAASSSSRLSSPKCILQCQRSFPLTFLSSLANHSALLSGCACSTSCCRSTSRIPRRSYSESRIPSSDRTSRNQRFSSPLRNSHMKRMQASGNLRNPVQGADECPSTSEENRVTEVLDNRTTGGGLGRRGSGSAQRRGVGEERLEKRQSGEERLEKRQSGSEQRRGGEEQLERKISGSECRLGGEERLEKRLEKRLEERLEKRRSGSEVRRGGEERLEKRLEERLEERRSGSEVRRGGEERLEKRLEERLEERRSGSEVRRGGEERLEKRLEERRSGSEVRRGGAELKDPEIKPDAVAAIMDNLPGFKKSPGGRHKQVDFVL